MYETTNFDKIDFSFFYSDILFKSKTCKDLKFPSNTYFIYKKKKKLYVII